MAGRGKTSSPDEDVTTSFISTMTTPREIQKPIAVQEPDKKKEAPRLADEYEILYDPETDKEHPLERFRRSRRCKLFITREIARYLDRKTFITVSFREAIIYCVFLILITLITLGSTPLDMFYFSQAMETLYTKQEFDAGTGAKKTFYDINTMNDVWNYKLSIIHSLYHDFWYSKPDPYENPETLQENYFENKLIGMPQIRQVRVRNSSCELQESFTEPYKNCYGRYSFSNEDKEDFGTSDEWKYKDADESETASIDGILTNYNGGGYIALLQNINDKATQTIYKLRNGKWIDRGTRAVFIEFTIYNGNINLFCTFKIIFEFPPCGGVIPSHWNYVQKFIKYNDAYDMFIFVCEIIFCIFFIFYTIQKLVEIKTLKLKLFKSFWNWIDIVILVVSIQILFNISCFLN
uniref:Uncharacterized protein n=1 Tax=Graphocephala atropunctata TaxID=36148 RepID=A0A1B6KUS0_9HEMI